jgi:hypothetical protein
MQRKLIIKILEALEKNFPNFTDLEKLGKEIKAKEYKISIKEVEQVINYLKQSGKIKLMNEGAIEGWLGGAETIWIRPEGIDYLTELRSLYQKERLGTEQNATNKSMNATTIVLALAAFIDVSISLILNSKGLIGSLGVSLFIVFIICLVAIFGYMGFLIVKGYKDLVK